MKKVSFTDDELRTLIWAVNNEYHRLVRTGKNKESETEKKLLTISKKAYRELISGDRKTV